jgi:hypothetical protein
MIKSIFQYIMLISIFVGIIVYFKSGNVFVVSLCTMIMIISGGIAGIVGKLNKRNQ